jgi:ABC-type antimicrobial peptide transport system permease subunit
MGEIVLDELRFERMESWLFGGFAVLALMLAVVGIYGLLSHEVEQGRRDIGIRMALGATRALVLRVVATRAVAMVTAGLAAGALLTFLANRAIAALLPYSSGVRTGNFNGAGTQLFVFAAMAICLFLISLLAALLPARRAATIEPMTALRME